MRARSESGRRPLVTLTGLLALLVIGACGRAPDESRPPHLVLVVVDTLRADHLRAYGYARDTTPRLTESLSRSGIVFERAFAHSGWTLPSMASLLTGMLPVEHGAFRDPDDPDRFGRLRAEVPTLAEILRAQGYRTGAFVNNTFLAPEFGLQRGFDRFDYRGASPSRIRSAGETLDAALGWLRESDRPAFLLLHFMEPHLNYDPPEPFRGRFSGPDTGGVRAPFDGEPFHGKFPAPIPSPASLRAIVDLYDEEILAVDAAVGRLLDDLRDCGGGRPTWVWITSDHGEEFWDHDGFEHGHQLFGELLRVPLIAFDPALSAGRVAMPVQHVDLFHTLVKLAGGRVDDDALALDLAASQDAPAGADDRPILAEDCLYGPPRAALTWKGRRAIVDLTTGRARMYGLDPGGQADSLMPREQAEALASRYLDRIRDMRGSLNALRPADDAAQLDEEKIRQLRALGYLR